MRACIAQHGGREVQFLGDGFLAAFPTPEAAVACATEVQRRIDEHNRSDPDHELHVRIGVHHGPVTEREGNLYGQTVHAAARVMAEASGDQILVSEAVREALVDPDADTDIEPLDRGLFWLKGFPDRWRLYEVTWRSQHAPMSAVPARTPFVEREEERAELRRAVDGARTGTGSLVLVAGEPGVGKSRLVDETAIEAETRGMRVLTGHCVERENGAPYLPFVEILEDALIAPRSPLFLREALDDGGPEIARLVPSLRRVLPDLPQPVDLPAEQAPRFMWNAVLAWLDRAARHQPLVLVLEDLHWADGPSLLLLEHLAAHLPGLPILVVGTYRDVEVGVDHPLTRMMNQLIRRHLLQRIRLPRLSSAGVAGMLGGLAGEDPPAALVDAIVRETEGNPFFVEEVFLHLSETGRLFDEHGRFRTDLRIDELDVPDSVRLVVGERLSRLSGATREALLSAAVAGRVFEPTVVRHVTGLSADDLIGALDDAERARLIGPTRDAGRLMFSHELIRQTLLADASSMRRQDLHARTATALEAIHADDLDTHAGDIAHHLLRSGPTVDTERLSHHLLVAGEGAMQAAAFAAAVAYFERALTLASSASPGARAAVLERLAVAQRSVGEWDAALATMDDALTLYEELGRADDIGRLCSLMVYQLAWAARFEEAMRISARGLAALGERINADRARLLAVTGWVAALAGDHDTATAVGSIARELAEQLRDDRVVADVLHMETIGHFIFAEFDAGIDVGLRAAETYEQQDALWDLCSVLSFVLYQAGTQGRWDLAGELTGRVADLAAKLGHLGAAFMETADRSRDALMRGDLTALRALAATQIELCERGSLPWLYVGYLYLGFVARWRGDAEEAERQLRRAMELEPPSAFAGQGAAHLAVELAYQGRTDEVWSLYEVNRVGLPVSGRPNSLGAWNALLGFTEAMYVAGFREEAAAAYPLIVEALDSLGQWVTFDVRFTSTRAGIAAAAAGLWEAAEEHYRIALEAAETAEHRIERADIHRLQARMYEDRADEGDDARAALLLELAADEYRAIGLAEPLLTRRRGPVRGR